MKKNVILLTIILGAGLTTNLFAQKDRKLTNGFSINLIVGFPSSQYGSSKDGNMNAAFQPGSIWGLQLGNRWYFSPKEKYGFGLMLNWADISAGVASGTSNGKDFTRAVADVSILEVGPIGSYVLNTDMAVDAYYNLRPTGFSSITVYSEPSGSSEDETYSYSGFGFSHALGAAFRYKALNIGIEYEMGGINSEGTYTGYYDDRTLDTRKNVVNNFRIMIGAKF